MRATKILLKGAAGDIDLLVETPFNEAEGETATEAIKDFKPKGIAWIGHPHPLFGGTRDNKVVQTMARALLALGYQVLRQNFRGVGASGGSFDQGEGETADAQIVLDWARKQHPELPIVLAGFSFGSVVAARLAQDLNAITRDIVQTNNQGTAHSVVQIEHIVLVGTAVTRWNVPPVPQSSLIIHGAQDDVIPLAAVQDWASQHELSVIVIEGTGHFFHGQLNRLKNLVFTHWHRNDLLVDEKT